MQSANKKSENNTSGTASETRTGSSPSLGQSIQTKNPVFIPKKQLAYLTALTLLFSYAELLIPKIVPFFKPGLSNAAILLALDMGFFPFFLLSILKATAASLVSGTLFSPFFIISLSQSVLSAFFMKALYVMNKKAGSKLISLYGISIGGSTISAVVQILLCSLYLGTGTMKLLGPILIFNSFSGLLTAFFAEKIGKLEYEEKLDFGEAECPKDTRKETSKSSLSQLFFALLLGSLCVSLFFIKNLYVLSAAFALSLTAQKLCKRRILLLPHISLWLFIFIASIFEPSGKVLLKFHEISLTQGALLIALRKSLILSSVSALSQCATVLKPKENTILFYTLTYYKKMSEIFRTSEGNIFIKIKNALSLTEAY